MQPKSRVAWTIGLLAFFVLLVTIVPSLLGIGSGQIQAGVQTIEKEQLWTYNVVGIGGALIILMLTLINIFWRKDDIYGDSLLFNSPGEFPSIPFIKKYSNPLRLFFLNLILMISLVLVLVFTKLSFVYLGIGHLGQSFSFIDNIFFNLTLVITSENLGIAGIVALFLFALRIYARKYSIGKINYRIISFVMIIILYASYGFVLHEVRYSASEASLNNSIGIFTVMGILSLITGSFIPGWVLHGVNNLFADFLDAKFSNELTIAIFAVILLFVGVIYFLAFRKSKKEE